jgi:Bardet-Biedl syndrome 2 protein
MNSAFSFKLSHAVQAGLVCVGQFDGRHPSLAFATSTGNVLIHNPHRTDLAANSANASSSSSASRANDVQQLAVNRKVTSLASGCFAGAASASSSSSSSASSSRSSSAGQQKDTLLVGTETNLMAYDVDRNSDLFFKVRFVLRSSRVFCLPLPRSNSSSTLVNFSPDFSFYPLHVTSAIIMH